MKNNRTNKKKIKKTIITILMIVVCFLLQTTLVQNIRVAGVIPNLMLLVVVFIAYLNSVYYGMTVGIVVGLLFDFLYASLIGVNMLAFLLIGYFCGLLSRLYRNGNYLIPLVMISISEFVYGIITYFTDFLLRGKLNIGYYFGKVILPELVYTIVVGILLYGFVCWMYEDRDLKGGNIL